MHKRYVMSSGRVNRYGYRIVPEGIQLSNYEENPVLLCIHEGKVMSVGKVNDLQIMDGKLTGIPEFDVDDPIGAELDRKYTKGYMSAFSVYHDPIEVSDDTSLALPGQTRATVLKTDLLEISCVNVPGDAGAHRLSADDKPEDLDTIIPKLNFNNHKNSNMAKEELKLSAEVTAALGLNEDASVEDAVQAIDTLRNQLAGQMQLAADALINSGVEAGVIDDDNKATYEKLAADDFETAEKLINSQISKLSKEDEQSDKNPMIQAKLSALLNKKKGGKSDKLSLVEEFEKLSKENPSELKRIKDEEPERYKEMALAYAGKPTEA